MNENTVNRYLKYAVSGVDAKPKTIYEWHKEDYADRVELYWMLEYEGHTFPEEIWADGYEDDPQLEADCEVVRDRIWGLIEDGYNNRQSVASVARRISKAIREN